ncbi:hypothetical protein ACHAXT_012033 [Thalassiosira profunda]
MEGVNDARPASDDAKKKPTASSVWTDDEFEAYLRGELLTHPLASHYPDLFATAPSLIRKWRERYHGNPALWKRLFAKDRVLKEFVEAAPFVDAIQRLVVGSDFREGEKFTVVDLACGRGYLSMLLSELLPPAKVERLELVDKGWAMHNLQPTSEHISSSHIYGSYYETWPIRLNTSKVNLKKGKEIRNMEKRLFNDRGPVILVAVHLCGTLSLRAVDLFNRNPEVRFFCLKPCCLPGMVHAKRDEVFYLGNHSFDSKSVCMSGRWVKNVWKGPPRTTTKAFFERWADNLFLGLDDGGAAKIKKTILVQNDGGYQNEFLFAERLPETAAVWEVLRRDNRSTKGVEAD